MDIYEDGKGEPTRYVKVKPDDVAEIVESHIEGGKVLENKEISEENNRNLIGVDTEVLVEELLDDGCGNLQAKGRASFQAPEVDGNVYIDHPGDLRPGDFVKAHIIDGYAYDLIAERITTDRGI